ncbi:MAG: M48 family metallopeptidase [Flavobacteriales bacterium]|nr:M48 family metallopeptidase [Flavobacteriales bacterium]
MTADNWLILIVGLIIFDFAFDKVLDFLNSRNWKEEIPDELKDHYDLEKYRTAKAYHKENGKLGLISSILSLALMLGAILSGAFGILNRYLSSQFESVYLQTAFFFLVLFVISDLISLPFSLYKTFRIEEKYGFNKTTVKTFILDKIKGYVLAAVLGGGLLWVVLFLIEYFQEGFWLWIWLVIAGFALLMNMFYADIILPLFNKLKPLEEGELKDEIQNYAKKIGYSLKNIYVIDGSKRSTKANAFFSGLGPRKTIALYDTLIEKHSNEELVAILAHEVGHFKKKHILVSMIISILQMGLMIFLFEQFIKIPEVSQALGAETTTFHIGLIAFGIVLSPVNLITGIFMSVLSRKNEYEADDFAKETYQAEPLIEGLKKLSVDNLANLHPHPFYVFVHYSHPPLLKRIANLRK